MKRTFRNWSVLRAAALLSAALTLGMALGFAQRSSQPPAATPSQAEAPRSQAGSNRGESGMWRRFGDDQSASTPQQRQYGVWHRFGENGYETRLPKSVIRQNNASQIRALERQMYEMVNREREDPANEPETRGQALPLRWNEELAAVARAHSLDMLTKGFFAHEDPEGISPAMRVEAAGMPWQSVAENIGIYDDIAKVEAAFMNEPRLRLNHRGNILNPKYTDIGIGIVRGPDGRYYITQDFLLGPTLSGN